LDHRQSHPELTSYVALGLIASFIYGPAARSHGYYDFERAAKPGVEITEVLICWFSTTLRSRSLAFYLKSHRVSRGAFLTFAVVAPAGLLISRKVEKYWLQIAVARGRWPGGTRYGVWLAIAARLPR